LLVEEPSARQVPGHRLAADPVGSMKLSCRRSSFSLPGSWPRLPRRTGAASAATPTDAPHAADTVEDLVSRVHLAHKADLHQLQRLGPGVLELLRIAEQDGDRITFPDVGCLAADDRSALTGDDIEDAADLPVGGRCRRGARRQRILVEEAPGTEEHVRADHAAILHVAPPASA